MKIKIFNKQILKRKIKYLSKIEDKNIFEPELKKKINKAYIFYFNNIVVDKLGNLNVLSFSYFKDFFKISSISKYKIIKIAILFTFYLKNLFKKSDKNIEIATVIHDRHSKNYFHWICDILPKLYIKKKYISKNDYIILPQYKTLFQKKSLQLLGFNNLFFLKKNIKVDNMKYIGELYPSGNPRPRILKKMRNDLISKFNIKKKDKKIYVSRKKAHRRSLKNEASFEKELANYGIETVYFEKMSFNDQVKISASSKLMIGVQGAGLINLIWMNKDSNLIDIRPKNDVSVNPFFSISQIFNINYYYHFCSNDDFFFNTTHSNYEINFKSFFKEFQHLLK